METTIRRTVSKRLFLFVVGLVVLFGAAGTVLILWVASDMRKVVVNQFNREQLVIAHNIGRLIEREIALIKKEIVFSVREFPVGSSDPDIWQTFMQRSLSRVVENGVQHVQVVDPAANLTYVFYPYRLWIAKELPDDQRSFFLQCESFGPDNVWVSPTQLKASKMVVHLGLPLGDESGRLLIFNLNISWFVTPFLKEIRSGRTGYAWIIDELGTFLYHPNASFIGKSAFTARSDKYPDLSYAAINFIQREKMLQGEEGTGVFRSAWHRGITGPIEKLIAYSPVVISDDPPQKWAVAVVAPLAEIEETVKRSHTWQFLVQLLIITIIFAAAAGVLFFEMRWSRVLEERVSQRTEELKRSEEKYRLLVESAEDFIFTIDSDYKIESMNRFTAKFFGGGPEDLLGQDFACLLPDEIAERQLKLVRLVFEMEKSVRDEFELQMGDHLVYINANFMPLQNEDGIIDKVLCIARDITESKNLEKKLINTEKLASIGTLAAGVAHEINNPLGVILGFSDLLLRNTDPDSQSYEDLKIIERQGLHCKQVVENLLSFSRLEEGTFEYADLNQCLSEILQVVRHSLEMGGVELQLDFQDDLPMVQGDPRQLQQVFLNIINNAIGAMKQGGALKIATTLERATRRAVVYFQDNGVGIKREHLDHVFEPFFTTKPEGEGTGLGLFVSYGIVTKFGGTIDCVSQAMDAPEHLRGTTVIVKLLTRKLDES